LFGLTAASLKAHQSCSSSSDAGNYTATNNANTSEGGVANNSIMFGGGVGGGAGCDAQLVADFVLLRAAAARQEKVALLEAHSFVATGLDDEDQGLMPEGVLRPEVRRRRMRSADCYHNLALIRGLSVVLANRATSRPLLVF
jgi:hypothetical protein